MWDGSSCQCPLGFDDIGEATCLICALSCKSCSGKATNCIACETVGTYRDDNSKIDNTCPC